MPKKVIPFAHIEAVYRALEAAAVERNMTPLMAMPFEGREKLGAAELDVLALYLQGLRSKEIAHRRRATRRTVETQYTNAREKLGCTGKSPPEMLWHVIAGCFRTL